MPDEEELHKMKPINESTVTFLSRSANEGFARSVAACFVAQLDPTLDELGDVKTAVSEAVTNAIIHGYPNSLGKVTLRLRLYSDNTVEIQVRDRGVGIPDVEQARTPLYTTGNEERSGMGFTIMESFMDRLVVRSAPGKGTCITMRKKISRRAGPAR
jgi:stage II sporulation protein AB (anti-sigma F factor)